MKRFTRSRTDRKLAGVCGGFGESSPAFPPKPALEQGGEPAGGWDILSLLTGFAA